MSWVIICRIGLGVLALEPLARQLSMWDICKQNRRGNHWIRLQWSRSSGRALIQWCLGRVYVMVGLHISFERYSIQLGIGLDLVWNMYSFKFNKICVKTQLFPILMGFYKSNIKIKTQFFKGNNYINPVLIFWKSYPFIFTISFGKKHYLFSFRKSNMWDLVFSSTTSYT